MTAPDDYRLGDLLGVEPPCDFLSLPELDALADERLPDERRRALEDHARTCPSCAALIADLGTYVRIAGGGAPLGSERRAFRAADRRTRERLGLTPAGGGWQRPWSWGLAAATAAAVVLILLRPPGRPALFPEIETPPLVPPPAVRGGADPALWERAAAAWQAGRITEAIAVLSPALEETPDDPNLLFYVGVAHLALGDDLRAVSLLERLDALQGTIPSAETRWYLAAALERTDRRADACATLQSVRAMGSTRAAAAAEKIERACPDQSAP